MLIGASNGNNQGFCLICFESFDSREACSLRSLVFNVSQYHGVVRRNFTKVLKESGTVFDIRSEPRTASAFWTRCYCIAGLISPEPRIKEDIVHWQSIDVVESEHARSRGILGLDW